MDLNVIRQRIKMVEDLEDENRISKDLLKSALENSTQFAEAEEAVKEAAKRKKQLKDQIFAEAEVKKTSDDIKANNEEIKTMKEILSAELFEYHQKNKTDEIEDESGMPRKFKVTVRLMPRPGRHEDRDDVGRYTKSEE